AGWNGHAQPFDMAPAYAPAAGIRRVLTGTPPILSLAALDAALDAYDGVSLSSVRAKSMALTDFFLALVDERLGGEFGLASPRTATERGSQISLRHPEGYAVVQALIGRRVVGDFRAPDILRFGLAPLYLRFVDVWDAVEHLVTVMATREWHSPRFRHRAVVT